MRIIVADDELHVRCRLEQKIDWESLGIDEVVLCDDGDEIIKEIAKEQTDIVLTDIRMARMDGIQAVREARKANPNLAVILMSAYDDKEYLKSALDLHVVGYLEKPFSFEQAQDVLKEAVNLVNRSRIENAAIGMERKHQLQRKASQIATRLCRYRNDCCSVEKEISQLFPEFAAKESFYAVLFCFENKQKEAMLSEISENGEEILTQMIEDCGYQGLCSNMKNGSVLCILGADNTEIREMLAVLQNRIEQAGCYWGQRIAVGSQADRIDHIYHSYQDAVITMERHFYHHSPMLFYEAHCIQPYVFTGNEQNDVDMLLKKGRVEAGLAYLNQLRDNLTEHDGTLVRSVKNVYFNMVLSVLQNYSGEDDSSVPEYYLWELFYQMNSLEQMHSFLCELVKKCCFESADQKINQVNISSILDYIDQNLHDPALSLTDISRRYFMSVTYLCVYFKEKTGTTIKSYIIEKRMKLAVDLLKYSDMKVAEIAEAVGFSDQGYFTKSFSKYFGKSPRHYKEDACEPKEKQNTEKENIT